ncbi:MULTISPECIES: ATP-grasp fold amidoligase family protein [Butyricimonas]|uniref:ATP-grasp fold amidoligase family protein n=1 Tax=Butyricimonas TaxID=574697 RepID=UPI0007FB2E31|nr:MULTISPECIES: ATP-grasp fold amidoligase family protein [Butyricimonas]
MLNYFLRNIKKVLIDSLPDKLYLMIIFRRRMGYWTDFNNPKSFSEKLQWLKLYNRKPIYTTMVDKYAVKEYVSAIIGEEYIIPTLGIWNSFDEIDFDKLPNQFVLKCTHDSGGLVICKDKNKLDRTAANVKISKSLKTDYYKVWREWPYKNVPKKIIAEQYMEDSSTSELCDYKFFCFDGEVKAMYVATDRQRRKEPYFDFFDENYNHLPFKQGHPNSPTLPCKPVCFEKMKELAKKLSQGIVHARIDFYEVDGKVFFGEITLFHFSGIVPFEPAEWDLKFGEYIRLQ